MTVCDTEHVCAGINVGLMCAISRVQILQILSRLRWQAFDLCTALALVNFDGRHLPFPIDTGSI